MTRLLTILVAINIALMCVLALGQPVGTEPASADAAGERGIIALTARNRTGDEVLYIIDPENKHLVGYEMQPKGLKLVTARRFDLDFRVKSYRDASEKDFTWKALDERFNKTKQPKNGKKRP